MKLASSTMADVVIAWFERFELSEFSHETKVSPADRLVFEIIRRADHARRRRRWRCALRDCHLALTVATDRQGSADEGSADVGAVKSQTTYTRAVVHLYYGMVLLAYSVMPKNGTVNYLDIALRHCQKSAAGFQKLKRPRAESIARASIGFVNAGHKRWRAALDAWQQSIAVLDKIAAQDPALKELRRQILAAIPMILDCYGQTAGPGLRQQH